MAGERFEHIYTSDMSRAFHKRRPFTVSKAIREINGAMNLTGRAPGGKAVQEEIRKRRAGIAKLARDLMKTHKWDDRVLIVAHGNLIRHLVSVLAGVNPKGSVRFETSNTSFSEVTFLWLQKTNEVSHLLPSQVS